MIAVFSEPVEYDADEPRLDLRIDHHFEALADSPHMQRLKDALTDHFGENLKVNVSYGPAKSPAALAIAKRVDRFVGAYSVIANDDIVAKLVEDFDAKVIVESVKPAKRMSPG